MSVLETTATARGTAERPVPLTERILSMLPGHWLLWALFWSSIRILMLPAMPRIDPGEEFALSPVFAVVFGYVNFVSLLGVRRLARDVDAITPRVRALLAAPQSRPFRATGNVVAPVLINTFISVLYWLPRLRANFGAWSIAGTLLNFIAATPLTVLLWAYVSIFLELNRLGASDLVLLRFEEDRSLGLRPLGRLASSAFWVAMAVLAPFVLFAIIYGDPMTMLVLGAMLLAVVGLLFLSLWRLHRQLGQAKTQYVAAARSAVAGILRAADGGESAVDLAERAARLQLVEARERRALAIQEWPFDEGILRTIIAITTSVITAVVVRLLTSRIGL